MRTPGVPASSSFASPYGIQWLHIAAAIVWMGLQTTVALFVFPALATASAAVHRHALIVLAGLAMITGSMVAMRFGV